MHFSGSVYGLQVGAPVVFRGVRVGSVESIEVFYDRATDSFFSDKDSGRAFATADGVAASSSSRGCAGVGAVAPRSTRRKYLATPSLRRSLLAHTNRSLCNNLLINFGSIHPNVVAAVLVVVVAAVAVASSAR